MAKSTKLTGKNVSSAVKADIQKATNLMVDIIKRTRSIWRKEITDWQRARTCFYSVDNPQTYLMHATYDDALLDGHLTGITEDRTLRNINKDYGFFDPDGKHDAERSKFIDKKSWFRKCIKYAHESTFRGTTVILVNAENKGTIDDVELIERGLVVPQRGLIVSDYLSQKGIAYGDFREVLLEAEFYNQIGLLEKAVPYTILKRHSWGSWDEFEELFGIPIRIAKIASRSEQVKNEVAGWLEEMGSSSYGVFPLGTEVEIKENSKSDAFNVFYMKIKALDAELSKLVLHQTMTTDSGSSRSQGEVHEETLKQVTMADDQLMLSFLNDMLVPAMRANGYDIPEGYCIDIVPTLDVDRQIKIDSELMKNGFIPTREYVERVYGMEVESVPADRAAGGQQAIEKETEQGKQ